MRIRRLVYWYIVLGLVVHAFSSFDQQRYVSLGSQELQFDSTAAMMHLSKQLEIGPRIPGSSEIEQVRIFIEQELSQVGWKIVRESFIPNESWNSEAIEIVNLIARPTWYDEALEEQWIYVAAHYDTRRLADQELDAQKQKLPVPGANDGASGVAILLELARVIKVHDIKGVKLIFFDAEDQGNIGGWPWIVGSTFHANNLPDPSKVQALILLDMVGDEDPQFYWEGNSNTDLREQIWNVAKRLGHEDAFIPSQKYTMIDDHVPFKQRGIPVVDIIDFDYPYWHTTSDTIEHVSKDTLQMVGETVEQWLLDNFNNGTLTIRLSSFSRLSTALAAEIVVFVFLTMTLARRAKKKGHVFE